MMLCTALLISCYALFTDGFPIHNYLIFCTRAEVLRKKPLYLHEVEVRCPNLPGIWNEEQVEAWKPVVKGVHDKGGPDDQVYEKPTPLPLKSVALSRISGSQPATLSKLFPMIYIGFDGIEINASSGGYLIDEFMNDQVNDRTDEYEGSVEDRCHLALEIVQEVANEIGADGKKDSNSEAVATYMANALSKLGVLYLHVMEPREAANKSLLPITKAFDGTLIASGGYGKSDGDKPIDQNYADLISFGRMFLANPDLPKRFEVNAPLNKHNRSTFYTNDPVIGYTDYPSLQVAS
ncbi:12-oxophytodienoate reductase-like protein [Capsicum annuum]|nr:12-oxophytodienoate reductase-like protein [Capsicum annuum]KAF3675724.1 12-oxophytodienoate reductase-like protein [Capsicum annuum]